MEREKTEELLRKYYEGLTTSEEEEELRDLLGKAEDEGGFAPDRILLSAGRAGVPEPSGEFIRNLEAVSFRTDPHRVSKVLPHRLTQGFTRGFTHGLTRIRTRIRTRGFSRSKYRYSLSVAAAVALILGSYFIFRTAAAGEPADTFSDPELAMAEVRTILLNVSQNMNTGTGALKSINTMSVVPGAMKEMGKTARSVDRSLSRLRYLNDLNPSGDVGREKENKNE